MKPLMHVLKGRIYSSEHYCGNFFVLIKDVKGRVTPCHFPIESINDFIGRKNSEIKEGKEIVVKGTTDINIYGNEVFYVDSIISCRESRGTLRNN